MMEFSRDGGGARPLGVTISGLGLIADAAISFVFIAINSVSVELDPLAKLFIVAISSAIAALEVWIGREILHRRRWLLGVVFPAFWLAAGVLLPPLAGEPAPPLYTVIYSWIAMAIWVFVVIALIWHRPWFAAGEEPIGTRIGRRADD